MAKKNKTDEQKLAQEIKKMETEKRKEVQVKVQKSQIKEVSFDSWYHQRADKIPSVHKKEILMADFKARGLGKKAKIEEYDKALVLYGIKL